MGGTGCATLFHMNPANGAEKLEAFLVFLNDICKSLLYTVVPQRLYNGEMHPPEF
jgi:hypothetical protein